MQTTKKVLIACDSSKSLIDFRGKLIEEMAKIHEVSVFSPVITRPDVREKLKSLNVTVYENHLDGSNVSMLSDLRYIIQLFKLLWKLRPDVFFPYTFKPIIYGTVLAKLCGVKCIAPMLTGLGYNFTPQKKKTLINRVTAKLLRFSLRSHLRLRIIFQNRDDYLTLLREKVLRGKHKIFIVNGSGVDLDHYQYTPADTNDHTFLMISRLINAKGVLEYYEAARILKARYPWVKFRLIGSYDKNIDSISKELFDEIKYGQIIQFNGEVEDVRPFIKASSVVVLPSYYGEGVPRSLLEAMAMGRAIITCNSVGCKETVNMNEKPNGFLVPVKNVAELVARMEYFITNPASVSTYGLNSLALASKKFNVHLINKQMMKIMQLNT